MTFTDWPGAGPVPDPEPEGFRDDQIAAERQRQIDAKKDQEDRNTEAYQKYCAPPVADPHTPEEPYGQTPDQPTPDPQTPDEPYTPSTPPPPPSPDPQSPTPTYGTTTPTPTTPTPTTTYGSGSPTTGS